VALMIASGVAIAVLARILAASIATCVVIGRNSPKLVARALPNASSSRGEIRAGAIIVSVTVIVEIEKVAEELDIAATIAPW
jgi:hypothetical protein